MNNNSVLCNDSDPEGDAIEALPISIPQFAASFEFDTTDGTFVYEHDGSEATTDSFIYRVRDEGGGLSSAVTVTINVIPENDPPIANDDEFTVDRGGRLVIEPADLLANDFDAEGNLEAPIPVVYPANGNFQELADGSFEYVHDGSSFEPDSFTYIVSDGATQSNEATVSINITLPPPSPGQNPTNRYDVNEDGFYSPIDALLIFNLLSRLGSISEPIADHVPAPPFYDVDGDSLITFGDANQVIANLNNGNVGPISEGESVGHVGNALFAEGEAVMVGLHVDDTSQSLIASEATSAPHLVLNIPATSTPLVGPAVAAAFELGSPLESAIAEVADKVDLVREGQRLLEDDVFAELTDDELCRFAKGEK
ncbi:MAG: Ig-like domain-containing protein, partial [Pirellulaceae bacterium]|nr:Ig-like domain-containing protein [Pirellulaceae bacterium]